MEILLFGIAREIVGANALTINANELPHTVGELRKWLQQKYPEFGGLSSLAIAVNSSYASDGDEIEEGSEVALIPPVSGG